jgi:hypothetical protein
MLMRTPSFWTVSSGLHRRRDWTPVIGPRARRVWTLVTRVAAAPRRSLISEQPSRPQRRAWTLVTGAWTLVIAGEEKSMGYGVIPWTPVSILVESTNIFS